MTLAEGRFAHYLGTIRGNSLPSQLVAVDTESLRLPHPTIPGGEVHRLRLGVAVCARLDAGAVHSETWHRFTTPDGFWTWLAGKLSPRRATWVFMHSAGWDLTQLRFWERLESGEYTLTCPKQRRHGRPGSEAGSETRHGLMVLDDPPVIVIVFRQGCTVRFVDTRNYWPGKLADLGDLVGKPKLSMPDPEALDDHWWTYCTRDTEIVYDAVCDLIRFVRDNDLGPFRYTAAGQSWTAYRHRFLRGRRVLIHDQDEPLKLARAAYFGGKTTCYYVGRVVASELPAGPWQRPVNEHGHPLPPGPVFALDVQSFYPALMKNQLFPRKLVGYHPDAGIDVEDALRRGLGVIAEVGLESGQETYPVRHKGATIYCRGRFGTVLCGPELARALRLRQVRDVGQVATYQLGDLFGDFCRWVLKAREFYREKGLHAGEMHVKWLANTLHGKFGQMEPTWHDCPEMPAVNVWGSWHGVRMEKPGVTVYRAIAGLVQRQGDRQEAPESCPEIAAYVTSWGRVLLDTLAEIAGPLHCYYADTDSVHVDPVGRWKLAEAGWIGPGHAGKLSERATARTACYYGPKHYQLDDRLVCAGLVVSASPRGPANGVPMEFDRLHSILQTRPNGDIVGRPRLHQYQDCHPTGSVRPDGWVEPLTL